ncbi:hypothetical protein HO173_000042 [Letharia columbiana]|uniref:F-box domain-containing protein n=1 Tax=Letharia columbiana TaxID=112416 RepID=A0A8H6LA97_9LECA|nr:uncharacterized protein HO173_000042 [Letharia columbiana]KAF6241332.1 hypothetical protein HO173_000042 [Letharia columbiana]
MPRLLDLPNEILDKIVDQIHPEDIINFSLSRLRIYRVARDAVSLHLERKTTYEDVVLHGCHRHAHNAHPLRLIQDICMDWRIGEYPKVLMIECCHHPCHPDNFSPEEDDNYVEEYQIQKMEDDEVVQTIMPVIQGYIEEKVAQSRVSNQRRFDVGRLCDNVRNGERDSAFAFLLFFLPNLEEICLAQSTWHFRTLEHAILAISEQNLQRTPWTRKPLMNLSQVRILGSSDDIGDGEDFQVFSGIRCAPINADDVWALRGRLRHAVIAEYLTELLAGIRALKRFTYSHNENLVEGSGMEPHKILGVLLEHAKHSLEYLSLTGRYDPHDEESDIDPRNGSLRDFEVLKEIVLDGRVYVEHTPDDSQESNSADISYPETHGHFIRHLVDVLPPSIETVSLVGAGGAAHVPDLLENLLEQKELRLPKLRNLIIGAWYRRPSGWEMALRERCEKVGVTLRAVQESERFWRWS